MPDSNLLHLLERGFRRFSFRFLRLRFRQTCSKMFRETLYGALHSLLCQPDPWYLRDGAGRHSVPVIQPEDLAVPRPCSRLPGRRQLLVDLADQNLPLDLRHALAPRNRALDVAIERGLAPAGSSLGRKSASEVVLGDAEGHGLQQAEDRVGSGRL